AIGAMVPGPWPAGVTGAGAVIGAGPVAGVGPNAAITGARSGAGFGAGGDALVDGHAAGAAAARWVGASGNAGEPPNAQGAAWTNWWAKPAQNRAKTSGGGKAFVDFQNDVSTSDVVLAHEEGYESLEHLKRYTTLGMGTDQGKTSNFAAA